MVGIHSTLIEWSFDGPVMPTNRDDESGRFLEEYPMEAFLKAVEELEVATTSKVAECVGCSYDLAYRRLNTLSKDGDVERTEVGGSFVWARTDT
jgi:hypothetical protein